ncbi:MAG: class I SAM-dependent methyltransferase [Cyanobacteria bacterium P01_H01_bin.15]
MSSRTLNLSDSVYEYLQTVSLREPPVLAALRAKTAEHPMGKMQICPVQGQFMGFLIQLMGANKALEIGVFTGYSSLVVALALPADGKIIACDNREEFTAVAKPFWEEAGVRDKIDLRIAPALDTLQELIAAGQAGTFDFAFIDADKSNYDNYYERCLELVRAGGVILVDNILWYGRVADLEAQDNRTQRIRDLNAKIHADPRVDLSLLPIGDGLTLARKR